MYSRKIQTHGPIARASGKSEPDRLAAPPGTAFAECTDEVTGS